jgi:ankyrin repeat protein
MQTITAKEFIVAAEEGSVSIIEKYVQEGSDINLQDAYGWTALMYASYHG